MMVAAVLYFDSASRRWIPTVFAVAALLGPFFGYFAAVYDAPLFAKWSLTLKACVLTLSSFVVTIGGYWVLFFAGLLFKKGS